MPSGFVRKSASPGCAPFFGQIPEGCTVPTTASPYFGSGSRIVWPPASRAPAARTCESAAAKTAASVSTGSSSGKAAIESASSGEPPIANTSLSAFVAAIAPKSAGSSTSGGKKSSVKTSARSSSSLYTAASSAGASPTSRFSASTGTKPASRVSSRAAEYFAAQPPAFVRSVSLTAPASTRPMLDGRCRARVCLSHQPDAGRRGVNHPGEGSSGGAAAEAADAAGGRGGAFTGPRRRKFDTAAT